MTVEQLREVHRKQPFQPFTLHLADGRKIHVPHPEFLAMFPSGRAVIVTHADESHDVIDLLLVTSLHVQNGKARRKRTR